jgi:hypothetical protein
MKNDWGARVDAMSKKELRDCLGDFVTIATAGYGEELEFQLSKTLHNWGLDEHEEEDDE